MASAALIDDRLQIDGFDVYTWSKTFGLPTGGFHKDYMDHRVVRSQIDESDTEYTPVMGVKAHTPASQVLQCGTVNPAPDQMFPARKYEFDNGVVTFVRPALKAFKDAHEDAEMQWRIGFILSALVFFYIIHRTSSK